MCKSFKQVTVPVGQVAAKINELMSQGWEFVRVIEDIPAKTYANGHPAGSAKNELLFREAHSHDSVNSMGKRQFILTIEVDEQKVSPLEDLLKERTPFELLNYLHSLVLDSSAAKVTAVVLTAAPGKGGSGK